MIKRLLWALLLIGCFTVALPAQTQAKDLFKNSDTGVCDQKGTGTSAVCTDDAKAKDTTDPLSGTHGVLAKVTNIVAFVAGGIAIIMILISALRYATSGSDLSTNSRHDSDVENAQHTISNAVVGLAVIVAARTLIFFVLSRL